MIDMVQSEGSRSRGLSMFKRTYETIRDILFPPQCADCGRVGMSYCQTCQHDLEQVPYYIKQRTDTSLQALASTCVHTGRIQAAIHALKYYDATYVAPLLAQRLSGGLAQLGWQFDVIVPVPMHIQRQKQRGYNQAQLIAAELALLVHKSCDASLVRRSRFTRSQVGLNREQRLKNLSGAFEADQTRVAGKRILLIDDVLTTGATISNCAMTLQQADAEIVYGLTLSRAQDLNRF